MKKIKVAEVEYNDDDGYDQHVLVKVKDSDTPEDVEQVLYDKGFMFVYVDDIDTIETDKNYGDYDVVRVLD